MVHRRSFEDRVYVWSAYIPRACKLQICVTIYTMFEIQMWILADVQNMTCKYIVIDIMWEITTSFFSCCFSFSLMKRHQLRFTVKQLEVHMCTVYLLFECCLYLSAFCWRFEMYDERIRCYSYSTSGVINQSHHRWV